ncbi:DUF6476 family protein [Shimia thalassica]|nr:DUF6476 family protein [Shimia thalassica]MBU2942122.1 hypothetical protein [Shimia thalassica]MDO6482860.1 DUF6476 family protein [Shimia thalassica]MDO6502909.1 DUF6476 family protein [Shimia thalassica]MDO6522499.1 DUF6476 family protein [Shimia thalassica]MDP2493807.1 DUF6476 family protein [Shimia thalassica]
MEETPEPVEPANLRFLRLLVTGLTGIMMVGLVVVVALIVIRLNDNGPTMPEQITLPDGVSATAITIGQGWWAVVTDDQRILIYDQVTGALKQSLQID